MTEAAYIRNIEGKRGSTLIKLTIRNGNSLITEANPSP